MSFLRKYLIWFGLAILAFGFLYNILFVNIPFQDAPVALEHKWQLQKQISELVMRTGCILLIMGIIVKLIKVKK